MITQEIVNNLFDYKDGILYWKVKKPNGVNIGDPAGSPDSNGYLKTAIKGKFYLNHRLIFLLHNGYLPKYIDHKDTNPKNNKIDNLREATHQQNLLNRKLDKRNTSGVKGVSWHKKYNKWQAQLQINGKYKFLGYFDNLEDAKKVVENVRNIYHKEFANHGH